MSLPNAITREDFYLNKIANPSDDHELPDAITRQQHYLKAIAENAGGGGVHPFVYSETEQVVGEWIDGKPLYQKTLVYSDHFYGNIDKDLTDLNIETIANIFGMMGPHNTYNYVTSLSFARQISSVNIAVLYSHQTKNLQFRLGDDYTESNYFNGATVTIQYTKSSDT